jgi:hypothetical protein
LIGVGVRSAYSTASLGLRPFDISGRPIDVVQAEVVVERQPSLEYLPMDSPEAPQQIVSGIYDLEEGRWRWMGEKAVILLKRPAGPAPVEAAFYIPAAAPARHILLHLDGVQVAQGSYTSPAAYTLRSPLPVAGKGKGAVLTITADQIFSPAGDHRKLGIILVSAGFR